MLSTSSVTMIYSGLVMWLSLVCFGAILSRVSSGSGHCESPQHYCLITTPDYPISFCMGNADLKTQPNQTVTAGEDEPLCKIGLHTRLYLTMELTYAILNKSANIVDLRCRSSTFNCSIYVHVIPASAIPNVTFVYSGGTRIGDEGKLTCIGTWTSGTHISHTWMTDPHIDSVVILDEGLTGSTTANLSMSFNPVTQRHAGDYVCGISAKILGLEHVFVKQTFTFEVRPNSRAPFAVTTPSPRDRRSTSKVEVVGVSGGGKTQEIQTMYLLFLYLLCQ